jgi:hypothetical protein
MENHAIGRDKEWTEDGLSFEEVIVQEYQNCSFSAGFVEGAPHGDNLYLKLERDCKVDTFLLLRPDEAAALAWCLAGVLYSHHIKDVRDGCNDTNQTDSEH